MDGTSYPLEVTTSKQTSKPTDTLGFYPWHQLAADIHFYPPVQIQSNLAAATDGRVQISDAELAQQEQRCPRGVVQETLDKIRLFTELTKPDYSKLASFRPIPSALQLPSRFTIDGKVKKISLATIQEIIKIAGKELIITDCIPDKYRFYSTSLRRLIVTTATDIQHSQCQGFYEQRALVEDWLGGKFDYGLSALLADLLRSVIDKEGNPFRDRTTVPAILDYDGDQLVCRGNREGNVTINIESITYAGGSTGDSMIVTEKGGIGKDNQFVNLQKNDSRTKARNRLG